MKNIGVAETRNVAILGHTGSGKTTLIDALLYKLGLNDRHGTPENGTSMADYTDEERQRKISIYTKPFNMVYEAKDGKEYDLIITDTPGYADFFGQVTAATEVADAALIMIDAAAGIQVGSTRSWRHVERNSMPRAIVISGLDKENTSYEETLAHIQSSWGNKCVPVDIPMPDGQGAVNVMADDVPDALADQIHALKGQLIEFAAETDDTLLEKYLEGERLTGEEIAHGLHDAIKASTLVPVFIASGKSDLGLTELLQGIVRWFPSPDDRIVKDKEGNQLSVALDAPFSGIVWRSVNDPFVGQLSFVRVMSGMLTGDCEIYNATREQKERIGNILRVNGKQQDPIDAAHPGDIVAIPKLKHTHLNDSLCAVGESILLPEIEFPHPVTSYAVTSKKQGDEDKLAAALHRIADEDPTLTVERNSETHELLLSGMGDVQIDVAVNRMKEQSNVEVNLNTPKVAYRETITGNGEGHHKHKKQSGGRGQYGEVYLRVEPRQPEEEEWFINNIVGGAIPSGFVPAVQKGLQEGMEKGSVAGYPVINVKISLYDGSYHDVDSSEIAFKIAGSKALHAAMDNARPVLLEPIMKVKVLVPDQFMGDVNGDLNHKRGRIQGMGSEDGLQVIEAEIPQAEMFKYSSELRSMTGGRGSFEMKFSRYETVPPNIAQKVVDAAKQDKEEGD